MSTKELYTAAAFTVALFLGASVVLAAGAHSGGHEDDDDHSTDDMLEGMRELHADHDHGHDFAAMDHISEDDMHRTLDFLVDVGLVVPNMDSQRGAELFFEKGCIVCHVVNGVGGEIGPSFNAADMPHPMNAFEFAARMWRGAPAMVAMQEDLFGEMIQLDGQQLADIVAFVHDEGAQSEVSADQIPANFRDLIP
ncbi:MAG: c-type cytochrome [Boseongicola sp.]|nr:c-type cytochrome [Boseongicola sp.]MDD9979238.1 c-type cytochrome [Boseongicola sp.]